MIDVYFAVGDARRFFIRIARVGACPVADVGFATGYGDTIGCHAYRQRPDHLPIS